MLPNKAILSKRILYLSGALLLVLLASTLLYQTADAGTIIGGKQSYTVSGAGTTGVNGTYVYSGTHQYNGDVYLFDNGGSPYYLCVDSNTTPLVWSIADTIGGCYGLVAGIYQSFAGGNTPPNDFFNVTGTLPVPTVALDAGANIDKFVSGTRLMLGDPIVITLRYYNQSTTDTITNAVITDTIPAEIAVTSIISNGQSVTEISPNTYVWSISSIAPNTFVDIQVNGIISSLGTLANPANIPTTLTSTGVISGGDRIVESSTSFIVDYWNDVPVVPGMNASIFVNGRASVAYDRQDRLHFAYDGGHNSQEFSLYRLDGAAWTQVGGTNIDTNSNYNSEIAFDSNNTPYVAYANYREVGSGTAGEITDVKVKKFDGTSWQQVGTTIADVLDITDVTLVIDDNDQVYLTYQHQSPIYQLDTVVLNNGAWQTINTISLSNFAYQTMIVDEMNRPIVAYREADGTGSVIRYGGESWVYLGGQGFTGESTFDSDLALDLDNKLHLAYRSGATAAVKVVSYNGSTWDAVGGDASIGAVVINDELALAIDDRNQPLVGYSHTSGASASYYDGTQWAHIGLPQLPNSSREVVMAVDQCGRPTLFGRQANQLNYVGWSYEAPQPDASCLQMSKIVDNATPNFGDTVQYTITITNSGAANSSARTLVDTLYPGLNLVPNSVTITPPTAGSTSGADLVNDLIVPSSTTVVVTYQASIGGVRNVVTNTATLNAGNEDVVRSLTDQAVIVIPNAIPVATANSYTTAEDIPLIGNLLTDNTGAGIDSDGDMDTLYAQVAVAPTSGSVEIHPSGVFTYTPALHANGVFTFTYQATDTYNDSAPAEVTITVTALPDPPVAVDDTPTTPEDTAITISPLANDTDGDNDPLSLVSITQPSNGTAVMISNQIVYTPSLNYVGNDVLTYIVTDGGLSDTGAITVTVTAVNDPPTGVPDTFTTPQDTPITVSPLTNDFDVDSGSFYINGVTQPTGGTVVVSGTNQLYFYPSANQYGHNTFTYSVTDGQASSSVPITITVNQILRLPPIATDGAYSIFANNNATGNIITEDTGFGADSSPSGGTPVVSDYTQPTNGSVTVAPDGSFTYQPPVSYQGIVSFTYWITDGVTAPNAVYETNPVDLSTSARSGSVQTADLDNDGDLDFIFSTINTNRYEVHLNQGGAQNGTNGDYKFFTFFGSDPGSLAVGDVNGDGYIDMIGTNYTPGGATVWLNQGSTGIAATFALSDTFSSLSVFEIKLGDLDGDNDLDAVLSTGTSFSRTEIWLNQGGTQGGTQGDFGAAAHTTIGDTGAYLRIRDIALSDVDGDNDLDLLTAAGTNGSGFDSDAAIWLNQGGIQGGTIGNFPSTADFSFSSSLITQMDAVDIGDIDNDGDNDVILAGYGGSRNYIEIYKNQGNLQGGSVGTFLVTPDQRSQNLTVYDFDLIDIDNDQDLDIVTTAVFGIEVWVNRGGNQLETVGTFVRTFVLGNRYASAIEAGDFDGDGDVDILEPHGINLPRIWWSDQIQESSAVVTITVSSGAPITPTIMISTVNANDGLVSWAMNTMNCNYQVHASTTPHFTPMVSNQYSALLGNSAAQYPLTNVLNSPMGFYRVVATGCDTTTAVSNEVGFFKFDLTPGANN